MSVKKLVHTEQAEDASPFSIYRQIWPLSPTGTTAYPERNVRETACCLVGLQQYHVW